MLLYTEEKKFTQEQVQQLFSSVHWVSANYPSRLYKALMNSSTVLTVWDGETLVGLTRVLDDTEMLAHPLCAGASRLSGPGNRRRDDRAHQAEIQRLFVH